eukprot:3222654-Pyramimonas_sp.AAC.1
MRTAGGADKRPQRAADACGAQPGISSRPSSYWFPPRVHPPVPPPIGSCPWYILPSLLRLVPPSGAQLGAQARAAVQCVRASTLEPECRTRFSPFPHSFELGLVPAPGISSRPSSYWLPPSSYWFPPLVYPPVPPPIGSRP